MTACLIASIAANQTRTEGGAIYFAALALGYIAVAIVLVPWLLARAGQAGQGRRERGEGSAH
jgi:predicted outer membrane repeat protein